MEKDDFYDGMRKRLKMFYPEKTDDDIDRMISASYSKFKDVIDDT